MALAMNARSHPQHILDYVLIVHLFVPELSGGWHDEELHCFPKVEMHILESAGHETRDLVAIDKEGDELALLYISIDDDFVEGSSPLTHIVNRCSSNLHRCHREVSEFHTLVHHVQCSKEPRLNVVLYIASPYFDLVNERVVLCA